MRKWVRERIMYVYKNVEYVWPIMSWKKCTSTKSKNRREKLFFGKMVITAPKIPFTYLKTLLMTISIIYTIFLSYLPSFFIGVKIYGTLLCKEEFTWDTDYYLLICFPLVTQNRPHIYRFYGIILLIEGNFSS